MFPQFVYIRYSTVTEMHAMSSKKGFIAHNSQERVLSDHTGPHEETSSRRSRGSMNTAFIVVFLRKVGQAEQSGLALLKCDSRH